jgi:hypothetical protein
MPITTSAVFKCDRDGTESPPIEAGPNMLSVTPPNGWSRVMVDVPHATPAEGQQAMVMVKGYLCPKCAGEFVDWISVQGLGKEFEVMKSPPEISA